MLYGCVLYVPDHERGDWHANRLPEFNLFSQAADGCHVTGEAVKDKPCCGKPEIVCVVDIKVRRCSTSCLVSNEGTNN